MSASFFWEQLRLRQRAAELHPVEAIGPRPVPALLGRAHHAPGNACTARG